MAKIVELRPATGYKVDNVAQPKRRRWNREKAYDNFLTVVGILGMGVWFGYLVLSWLSGKPW